MFNNIKSFLVNKEWNDTTKHELYVNYIKYRELKDKENKNVENLVLLFNKKTDTEIQKECNGLIIEKNTNKIVASCQHDFEQKQPENHDEYVSAEYCEDGTIIRLYNYNGIWTTATKKCIDAKYSFWSNSKTFNEMFWEVFGHEKFDLSKLDKDHTYIFALLHVDNILVVKHTENSLVYLACINNITGENCENLDLSLFSINPKIRLSEKLNLTEEDLVENYNFNGEGFSKLDEKYFNPKKRGILIKYTNNRIYKVDFKEFVYVQKIRGNEPFIRIRYLELLNDPENLYHLTCYYSEHHFTFSMIHHTILSVCNEIYMLYRNTHVKHKITIDNTHEYFKTIKQLHAQYKTTNKPITKEDVYNKFKTYNIHILKKLLKWAN